MFKYVHIKENITEVKVASSTRFQVTHNISNLGNLICVYLMSQPYFQYYSNSSLEILRICFIRINSMDLKIRVSSNIFMQMHVNFVFTHIVFKCIHRKLYNAMKHTIREMRCSRSMALGFIMFSNVPEEHVWFTVYMVVVDKNMDVRGNDQKFH